MTNPGLKQLAQDVVAIATKKGANDAAASAYRERSVDVQWRDGKLEKVSEATTRGVSLQLYVDGRYAAVSTSDLRPEALDRFVGEAVTLTRVLAKDAHRALPDPKLYAGQAGVDLMIEDPAQPDVTAQERRKLAEELEALAHQAPGKESILSVTSAVSDSLGESCRVHSNGFTGERRATLFGVSLEVSVKDKDGRRPQEYEYAQARHRKDLPAPAEVARLAAARAMGRLGSQKMASTVLPMAVSARAAGNLVGRLMGPLGAGSLQQKRSFFEGKLGQQIGSPLLDVTDQPLVVKGLGSRKYDGEGIAAKPLPIFQAGVVKNYYVDNYYGRKLGMAPTTGGMSNHEWKLGTKGEAELLAAMGEGVLVTGFLGGNSNGTTGDFSLGVQGFRVRGGKIAEPVAEMNVAGNHLDFWKKLVAVGNDPFAFSQMRTPTLVFEGVQFAGV